MNRFHSHFTDIVNHDILFKDHFLNVMQLPKLHHITLNIGLGKKAVLDKKQILIALTALELISEQKPCITRAHKSIDKFKLRENMPLGSKVTLRRQNMFTFFDKLTNIVLPSMDELSDSFVYTQQRNLSSISHSTFLPHRFFYSNPLINRQVDDIFHKKQFEYLTFLLFQNNLIYSSSKTSRTSKTKFLSFNFGIKDFFLFKEVPYDKIDISYGLDVSFNISSLKTKKTNHLFKPKYLLTAFQMPLGILTV